jgi:hypothetical protein
MTNYKKSLESSIIKGRLSKLMESLEKTNASKMILERYYSNICTIEITEGTSTSIEVTKELKTLGLNESKIISAVSSSVVPERTGVADQFAIRKIALLESLCSELKPYSWMKSVSIFIAETNDYLREFEMPILLERIIFDLENDRNSRYYKGAIDVISKASISENPIFHVLENAKDQKWIPLVNSLFEYCESKKGDVNGTNPNFKLSKIYSPVEFISERESFIFNSNGKTFETDGESILEFEGTPSDMYNSLLAVSEKSNFSGNVMRIYPNTNTIVDINFESDEPKVFVNNRLVENSNVESHLIAGGHLRFSEVNKFSEIQHAIAEGKNIKEIDFGYTVTSKMFEGVSVSVFTFNNDIYIQKVNKGMNENTLTRTESAEDAIRLVKEFINYDITNSIKYIAEAEETERLAKENEINKQIEHLNSIFEKESELIRTRIKTLTESLEELVRAARLSGVENSEKVIEAKNLLETQIENAKNALTVQEELVKKETNKLTNLEEVNESCVPGKEYKIAGEAGWVYQGVSDGFHIFNNEVGGKEPRNYSDEEFAAAHKSGEITECAM